MNDLILKIESPLVKTDLTATGWNLPTEITESDWKNAGQFLVRVDQARQWWLGDWWNACKWGDGKQACEEMGVDYQTAVNCGNVSKKIQFNRRRLKLRFSHHAEVCPIEDEETQNNLLDWAVANKVTVKALREKVQAYQAMKDWALTEKSRRFEVESGKTVIANMKADVNLINWAKGEGKFVQIDRSTLWGNPFEIPGDGDRDKVCDSYMAYFELKKSLHEKLKSLAGKVLGCWCYPEKCHGNYLIERLIEGDKHGIQTILKDMFDYISTVELSNNGTEINEN